MSGNTTRSPRPILTNRVHYNQITELIPKPERKRKKRTNFVKIFCFLSFILLAVFIVVTYYLVKNSRHYCDTKPTNVCVTKDCVISASTLMKTMDTNVNPCDDFFEFSCGQSFSYSYKIPEYFLRQTKFKLNLELKNLIEKLNGKEEPAHVKNIYKFYKSCSDEDRIEKQDIEPLEDIIEELGGWPALTGKPIDMKHYDWLNTYIMMRKIGIRADSLIKLNVGIDIKNNSRYIAYIDQPKFNIQNQFNSTERYFELMVKIIEMMGTNNMNARNDLIGVLNFEKQLINISLSEVDHKNSSYFNENHMKVNQIESLAPNINWIQYLTEFIGTPISDNYEVIVLVPSYIKSLDELLSRTNKRVLLNYLIWRVVFENLSLLSDKWKQILENYSLSTKKDYVKQNRWEICAQQIQQYMPYGLGSVYLKNHFNTKDKVEMISMLNNIRGSLLEMIDKNKWMTREVKKKAKVKALLMDLWIGLPKELLEDYKIDSYMRNIDISDDYFKNIINLKRFYTENSMNRLINNYRNDFNFERVVNPADIILKYKYRSNALLISSALLNDQLFKQNLPKFINYGSLGILIGQQMMKGFDKTGSLYDENGIYRNWWDHKTNKNFELNQECLEYQMRNYNHSIVKSLEFRDRISLIERVIRDIGVFKQSIHAYNGFVGKNRHELGLVGFDYTPEQLFWINGANTLCWKQLNSLTDNVNPYETTKYRINALASNLKEFSHDFNCPVGSAMNRNSRCMIW